MDGFTEVTGSNPVKTRKVIRLHFCNSLTNVHNRDGFSLRHLLHCDTNSVSKIRCSSQNGIDRFTKITCSLSCDFITQLVRTLQWYRSDHGFESR